MQLLYEKKSKELKLFGFKKIKGILICFQELKELLKNILISCSLCPQRPNKGKGIHENNVYFLVCIKKNFW